MAQEEEVLVTPEILSKLGKYELPHLCQFCEELFPNLSKLFWHVKQLHTSEKASFNPEACTIVPPKTVKYSSVERLGDGYPCLEDNCEYVAETWKDRGKHISKELKFGIRTQVAGNKTFFGSKAVFALTLHVDVVHQFFCFLCNVC